MKYFRKIMEGIKVNYLLNEIEEHPLLWNQHSSRTRPANSPHRDTSDIWIRQNPDTESKGTEPHDFIWYPGYEVLPSVRPLIFGLMRKAESTHLGAVYITKIPSERCVYTHIDKGWHPEFHQCKIYVPIQTNERCFFRVGDEQVVMKTGEAWVVNNLIEHDVINDGNTDRITMIICTRVD